MITKEHLLHWLGEIQWQLNGIASELAENKVQMNGINVGKNGEAFVSFEYLREKADKIKLQLNNIEWDMNHDQEVK